MLRPHLIIAAFTLGAVACFYVLKITVENTRLKTALDQATAYIEATKETTDALTNLPDDPDAILAELCRIAGRGESCGDLDAGSAPSDGTRGVPNIQ